MLGISLAGLMGLAWLALLMVANAIAVHAGLMDRVSQDPLLGPMVISVLMSPFACSFGSYHAWSRSALGKRVRASLYGGLLAAAIAVAGGSLFAIVIVVSVSTLDVEAMPEAAAYLTIAAMLVGLVLVWLAADLGGRMGATIAHRKLPAGDSDKSTAVYASQKPEDRL